MVVLSDSDLKNKLSVYNSTSTYTKTRIVDTCYACAIVFFLKVVGKFLFLILLLIILFLTFLSLRVNFYLNLFNTLELF